ncbi:hypothetical protein PV797_12515 [Clostridiaceae bacterium M8S5]|nr:hypothetical protein PV797_12515 [Clostridiaceae bacterium M8S5]
MRILVGQPIHEVGILQLRNEVLDNNTQLILYPEGYLENEKELEEACKLAKERMITIISSYRKDNKDRAVIINNNGEKILERDKTPKEDEAILIPPLVIDSNGLKIGYILCMEILKGERDLANITDKIDLIFHPIGVGMFSDAQYELWINLAKKIAKRYSTMVIGTSHADGSYRNCGVSIPISYCIDENGECIYISKSDTRSWVFDYAIKKIEILNKRI